MRAQINAAENTNIKLSPWLETGLSDNYARRELALSSDSQY